MASDNFCLYFEILTVVFAGAILIDAKRSFCSDIHLVQESGRIHSENYPHAHPNSSDCSWTILSPPYSVLTLTVKDIDIEDDQNCILPPCCEHNFLALPLSDDDLMHKFCGHNLTIKPIHLSRLETKIVFHSIKNIMKSRGFLMSWAIEAFHSVCQEDEFKCANSKCLPAAMRCDGVSQCTDGSDEVTCKGFEDIQNSNKVIESHNTDKCIHQSLWCDGNYACNINTDQETCLRNSVVSATIMGCLFCGLMLVIAMMCGLRLYTMHNDNTGNYRIQLPANIATRLNLTRYISLPELIDDDFFHREPPPSYSIAVGQPNGSFEALSSHSGRRSRSWRQRSLTPIKPPTPPPSSETSNQSSPSRDSITSSSYLSNDDNIHLVEPQN